MRKEKKEVKNFLLKFLVFSFPILLVVGYIVYTGLVLPVDYFTFRAWEALSVYKKNDILSGPFYPNMHLTKTELGDLSGLSKYPVAKEVEWYTDKYGYRIKNYKDRNYQIVIIGDSSIAGSALTQDKTISEIIYQKTGLGVYPYAPSNFNNYLKEKRFKDNPPKIVVIGSVEKLVLGMSEVLPKEELVSKNIPWSSWGIVSYFAIMEDRLKKDTFVNYIRARFKEIPRYLKEPGFKPRKPGVLTIENPGFGLRSEMVFYSEPEAYFKLWKESEINRVVFALNQYIEELAKTSTKLIFMPIPNKENIYWRQVKGGIWTNNLKRLVDKANESGIATVDLWSVYNSLYNKNPDRLLYHTDDTHWNEYGVDVASDKLIEKINEISKENN